MEGAGGDDFVTEERDKDGRTRRVLHHRVRASDTLQGLAIQFSVTVEELRRANKLWANDTVHLRKWLLVPLTPAMRHVAKGNQSLRAQWGLPATDPITINGTESDNEAGSSRSRTASSASSASIQRLATTTAGVRHALAASPATSLGGPDPWALVAHEDRTTPFRHARGATVDERILISSDLEDGGRSADGPPRATMTSVVEDATGTWALNIYGVWQQLKPDDARLRAQRERMEQVEDDLLQL